jgi:hypothetical protein
MGNKTDHQTSSPSPLARVTMMIVACARLLRAFIVIGDYHSALDHIDAATRGYLAAPSDRARRELRHCRRIIRDRTRADKALPLHALRRRIEAALQGDTEP